MLVAHFARADTARASGGVENIVRPLTEGLIVREYGGGVAADAAEIVVRRGDFGGEGAGVESPLRRQHGEAAHAAAAEAVELGLAIAVEGVRGAGAGVNRTL